MVQQKLVSETRYLYFLVIIDLLLTMVFFVCSLGGSDQGLFHTRIDRHGIFQLCRVGHEKSQETMGGKADTLRDERGS